MCDTKYFTAALDEALPSRIADELRVGDLSMRELSLLLRRAQELKDADRARENQLGRMGD